MHWKMSTLGPVSLLAMGLALMVGVSHAQYPPQGASVQVSVSNTSVQPGGNTSVTIEVTDEDNQPAANATVVVSITDEPQGSDSALGSKSITRVANGQGIVTTNLYVGTVPGVLVIEAESLGVTSTVLVVVEGEEPSPPQSSVEGITPPNTGSGGLAH
jgi:hypothetical protein